MIFEGHENLLILEFDTTKEAADFLKSIDPESNSYLNLYDIEPYGRWLFIKGVCDICGEEQIFFIPASAYEEAMVGSECSNCGNMSVFPEEGDWSNA